MDRSREKSLFLRRERDVWDCLTKERRSHEKLVEKFTSMNQELVGLWSRKAKARQLALQAEEKLKVSAEKAQADAAEAERLLKERDAQL